MALDILEWITKWNVLIAATVAIFYGVYYYNKRRFYDIVKDNLNHLQESVIYYWHCRFNGKREEEKLEFVKISSYVIIIMQNLYSKKLISQIADQLKDVVTGNEFSTSKKLEENKILEAIAESTQTITQLDIEIRKKQLNMPCSHISVLLALPLILLLLPIFNPL